ncbi:hypothetical protein [Flavobacterium urocaniciphilum]|uniref:Uncharacterized protein n=1 Tax=Flavobacterium urocaniciphilum TaxID=1299341 RepID=A0A1H9DY40_9FLAO|nr:hypothetical protein [Flavobacterium urocaniciphilum]SEQ17658.1 hypothetical protein SAMN05444005_10898 [Flavobacterium urocaniciphilum]
MKKKIEGELISIAHRLLKLKNHTETVQLHEEVKKLYEQLTLLKFYEENTALVNEEFTEEAFLEKVEKIVVGTIEVEEDEEEIIEMSSKEHIAQIEEELFENNEISHEAFPGNGVEKIVELTSKENINQIEEELIVKNDVSHEVFPEKEEVKATEEPKVETIAETSEIIGTKASKQITIDDVLVHDYQDTLFVKKEDIIPIAVVEEVKKEEAEVVETKTEPVVEEVKEEIKAETIVEEIKEEVKVQPKAESTGKAIVLGLNDKVAFERNLFANNGDDLNRVISQLNTFTNWDEAKSFVLDFVKPDYNNWEGKEEFETRFLEIVENKFK